MMTANFLRRNWPIACRSQMRKGGRWQHSPGSRRLRRQRHSLGSFGPWNKRGHRRSVLLRGQNRSPRAACRSPHSKPRHRPTRRLDARHSFGWKPVAAQQQVSGGATDAISFSSVPFFLWSSRGIVRAPIYRARGCSGSSQTFRGPKMRSRRFTNLHRVVPRSCNYADDCGGRTRQSPRQRQPR